MLLYCSYFYNWIITLHMVIAFATKKFYHRVRWFGFKLHQNAFGPPGSLHGFPPLGISEVGVGRKREMRYSPLYQQPCL